MCVFAASEPQTGDGEEVVGGELGELQAAVCQAQVEGEWNVWMDGAILLFFSTPAGTHCLSFHSTAVIQNSGFVQPFNPDHEERPQAT